MAFAFLNSQTGVVEIVSRAGFAQLFFIFFFFHSNGDGYTWMVPFQMRVHVEVLYVDMESLSGDPLHGLRAHPIFFNYPSTPWIYWSTQRRR